MPCVFWVYVTPQLFDIIGNKCLTPLAPTHPQQSSTVPSVPLSLQSPSCFWWMLDPCMGSSLQGALLRSSLPKKPQASGSCPATCPLSHGMAWPGMGSLSVTKIILLSESIVSFWGGDPCFWHRCHELHRVTEHFRGKIHPCVDAEAAHPYSVRLLLCEKLQTPRPAP